VKKWVMNLTELHAQMGYINSLLNTQFLLWYCALNIVNKIAFGTHYTMEI
jgi:hypothetical protein